MLFILTPIFCVALLCGTVFSFLKFDNKVTASAAAAYGELYDSAKGKFSKSALDSFAVKAGYTDVKALIKAFNEGASPIKGSQFGTNTLTVGGTEFYPVYVPKAGNYVALTLLTKNTGTSPFSDGTYSLGEASPPSNMYSTSYLHACINAGQTSSGYYAGNYAGKTGDSGNVTNTSVTMHPTSEGSNGRAAPTTVTTFVDFAKGGKYSDYIIAPKDTYQATLSTEVNDIANTNANYINKSNATYNYSYTSWANDNVWLPSYEEVVPTTGTWAMTTGKNSASVHVWTRSAGNGVFREVKQTTPAGAGDSASWCSTVKYAYRAGIHLNLSKAAELDAPKNVEAVYTGQTLDLSAVAADKKTWFDSNLMDLDYPSDNSGDMKDAGTYSVKVTLKNGLVFDGTPDTTKGETDSVRYFDFKINPIKLTPPSGTVTITYNGEEKMLDDLAADKKPAWYDSTLYTDPSIIEMDDKVIDAGNKTVKATLKSSNYAWFDETTNSSKERTFTFKVNKKELEVEFEDNGGVKVAKFKDTNEIYTRDSGDKYPKLITKYSKNSNAGSATFTSPNNTGTWYAHAFLENAESCNYSVANAGSQFELNKIAVAYPKLSASSSASEEYNGEEQEFTFEGYDPDLMTCAAPTGADSFDGTTLKVTNAGTYAPEFTLINNALYVFTGTAPSVEITVKPVVIDSDSANATSWEKGTATTLTFEVTTPLYDGDTTVNLVATYTLNGGDEQNGTISVNGTTGTVTIGKSFAKGSYVLTVKTADGENYSGACTHNFSITAKGLSLGSNDIKWSIDGKPYVTADYDDGNAVYAMEYTGKPLDLTNVSVNFSSASDAPYLEQDGDLTGTFINAVNVGEYTATFAIKPKSSEETCSDGPFTLTIKIVPKKLDFSKAEWEYSSDGTNWTKFTATSKPSYTGNAVSIRISPDYMKSLGLDIDNGDYTDSYTPLNDPTEQGSKTTNVELTINNGNYTTADESGYEMIPFNWEITARALTYGWTTQTVEAGGNAFEFPAISFDDPGDYSQYYEYVYVVDGNEYTLDEIKAYIAANWSETNSVSGTVRVQMKNGVTEVNIPTGSRPFSTGTPKTALTVDVTGSGAEFGKVDFALSIVRGTADERARTTVAISGGALSEAKSFEGTDGELVAFVNGLGAGNYVITVSLKAGNEDSYVLTRSVFDFEVLVRKIVVPQVKGDITFNGEYINIVDYLDDNYNANVMSMLSGYTNKTAGSYTVTFKLVNGNYMWVEPAGAEPMSKLFAKALFANEISINNPELTATLGWTINKIVLATDGWNLKSKTGASLNALAAYQDMITANSLDVNIGYRYYDTNGNLIEEPVLKGGDKYIVEAYLVGEDAVNFEFADGTDDIKSISARKDYAVPQSAVSAFFGSAVSFAKANWLWLVIAAVVLLFLIILICIIASAKKKKRRREELAEQRRLEEKEERKREQEERRLEREERMARMSQAQAMPQYIPQPVPQPQYMPQGMPQSGQPAGMGGAMGGGSITEAMFMQMQAEFAAMKAEQAAKELAEIRAEQAAIKAEQNAMRNDFVMDKSGAKVQAAGISVDAMTEIMTMALKNVLASATQQAVAAQPAQPAQLTEGGAPTATANAVTQIPPDAVMTTVTTTKIDTTKKTGQPADRAAAQAAPARTVVRNFVAPMPVDDGRVFDVGGFYKPADPITDDISFGEEEKKD